MAIRLPRIVSSKKDTKGYFAVYVGGNQKRFVIPVPLLSQPLFQDLLGMSEEKSLAIVRLAVSEFLAVKTSLLMLLSLELIARELAQISKNNFVKQTSFLPRGADISLPKCKIRDDAYCKFFNQQGKITV